MLQFISEKHISETFLIMIGYLLFVVHDSFHLHATVRITAVANVRKKVHCTAIYEHGKFKFYSII